MAAGLSRSGREVPDLVWSGPEVPGLHAHDTRRVYRELLKGADRFWGVEWPREAALDRNIELGLLVRDRALAASVVCHFRGLIDREMLSLLPEA